MSTDTARCGNNSVSISPTEYKNVHWWRSLQFTVWFPLTEWLNNEMVHVIKQYSDDIVVHSYNIT